MQYAHTNRRARGPVTAPVKYLWLTSGGSRNIIVSNIYTITFDIIINHRTYYIIFYDIMQLVAQTRYLYKRSDFCLECWILFYNYIGMY